jgi:hypothetical protein
MVETIVLSLWCLGFGYFIREWTTYDGWRYRARAVIAAVLWPLLLVVLLLSTPFSEESETEDWRPPPPPQPPESLFPDDEW